MDLTQVYQTQYDGRSAHAAARCMHIDLNHYSVRKKHTYLLKLFANFSLTAVTIRKKVFLFLDQDWQIEFGIKRGYLNVRLSNARFIDRKGELSAPLKAQVVAKKQISQMADISAGESRDRQISLSLSAEPSAAMAAEGAFSSSSQIGESSSAEFSHNLFQVNAIIRENEAQVNFEDKLHETCLSGYFEGALGHFVAKPLEEFVYRGDFIVSPDCIYIKNLEVGERYVPTNKMRIFEFEAKRNLINNKNGTIISIRKRENI